MGPPPGPLLEAFKFTVYLAIPIIATIAYSDPQTMKKIIDATQFVTYPPEAPRHLLDPEQMARSRREVQEMAKVQKELKRLADEETTIN